MLIGAVNFCQESTLAKEIKDQSVYTIIREPFVSYLSSNNIRHKEQASLLDYLHPVSHVRVKVPSGRGSARECLVLSVLSWSVKAREPHSMRQHPG